MREIHKIAWIGLGSMGVPMVQNLASGEERVTAFNRTPVSDPGLGKAIRTSDVAEAVEDADVIFLMVSDGRAVRDVLFGSLDVVGKARAGTLIVNMSTIGVDETKEVDNEVQAAGLEFMDAPVSGSIQPAREGALVVMAGGSDEAFAATKALFERMANKVFHLGGVGAGAAMKLLMNAVLGLMLETAGECMALADKSGLSREAFLEVLSTTGMWAPIFKVKQPLWTKGNYEASFALKHMAKDLQLASSFAQDTSVSAPAIMAAMAMFMAARDEGHGEQDMAAVSEYIGKLAKL